MKNIKSGLEKVYNLRIVFMFNSDVKEFMYEVPDGIEVKFLETLYNDINRLLRDGRNQLLIILPMERLSDPRVPVFVTQDFDSCSVFSIEDYFKTFNLKVKKSHGRVTRVVSGG